VTNVGAVSERDRIQNQLERAFEGEAWHGPSVLEALEGVTWERAAARPIAGAHSIWELVRHITVWEDVVRRRLQGESPEITDEQNFPTITDPSEESWKRALEDLRAGHAKLRDVVAKIRDEDLDEKPHAKTTTRYILLHGIIQHDIYHAGQIAILKK
jgi:uncharacterized damage-inducible protein DinB